jgi:hypothetical protein
VSLPRRWGRGGARPAQACGKPAANLPCAERFSLDGAERQMSAAELVGALVADGWTDDAAHAVPAEVLHAALEHRSRVVESDAAQLGLDAT